MDKFRVKSVSDSEICEVSEVRKGYRMIRKKHLFSAVLVSACMVMGITGIHKHSVSAMEQNVSSDVTTEQVGLCGGVTKEFEENLSNENKEMLMEAVAWMQNKEILTQDNVYTFLQGPRAYSESQTWSGEWATTYVNKNSFGGFGCGLCCMANIYSTLSGYECSPLDMLDYARAVSGYYPTKKSGAIGWESMNVTMQNCGFTCELLNKPDSYEEFQEQMKTALSAVVLVSSYNDDTFWKDTSGHYVNIWLYDETTDQVFLAEPGDPENNRSEIALRYVYDALKTSSQYQYLLVTGYSEESNQWKSDGIDDVWNAPY